MNTINIKDEASEFAEDKDVAARIRDTELRPALESGQKTRLDFSEVTGATQSFVHALISGLIRREGGDVLDLLEFARCNEAVKHIVQIVCEYSQYDVADAEGNNEAG